MSHEELKELVMNHTSMVSFLGALLIGNSVTLFFSTLAGQGIVSWWKVGMFALLGNFIRDLFWYWIGRSRWVEKWTSTGRVSSGFEKLKILRERYSRNDWMVFILVKFIYGLRVIAILFFGSIRYDLFRFFRFDFIAVCVITTFIVGCGWMTGKGVGLFINVMESAQTAITFVVVFCLLLYLFHRGFRHWSSQ